MSSRRTDINEICIAVVIHCNLCKDKVVTRWYPRKNWRNYAKIDIFRCPVCSSYCKFKSGKETSIKFEFDGTSLYSIIPEVSKKIQKHHRIVDCLSQSKINILLKGLELAPFNGTLSILDDRNVSLVTFHFGAKGLQYIELNNDLLIKFGAILDEKELEDVKAKQPRFSLGNREVRYVSTEEEQQR